MQSINLFFSTLRQLFSAYPLVAVFIGIMFVTAWLIGMAVGGEPLRKSIRFALVTALIVGVASYFLTPIMVDMLIAQANHTNDLAFRSIAIAVSATYVFLLTWPLFAIRYR